MKTAEQVLDALYNFTQTQKTTIDSISSLLLSIKDKKISKDTLDVLTNCFKEIDGIRENIIVRLLNSLKRGDQV